MIELVAVIVIISIITASIAFKPQSSALELQASRDNIISIFKAAQNLAMSQNRRVSFKTQGNTVLVLIDTNNDNTPDSNADIIGESFPQQVNGSLNTVELTFNKLGYTQASLVTVSSDALSVDINISATGYVY